MTRWHYLCYCILEPQQRIILKTTLLIITLITSALGLKAQDWGFTYRAPAVSTQLFNKMKAVQAAVVGMAPLVTNEWTFSDPLASYYGEKSYFTVGVSNALGGAVLMIQPIGCNSAGLITTHISFSDETRGPSYAVNLVRVGTVPANYTLDEDGFINESYLHGTLNLDGQDVHILVLYYEWPDQPTMLLTWGEGAEVDNFGTTYDGMGEGKVVIQPTQTRLLMEKYPGSTNFMKGMYLDVDVAWNAYVVESSSNLTNWTTITNRPYLIDGYKHSYYLGSNSAPYRFMRALKL